MIKLKKILSESKRKKLKFKDIQADFIVDKKDGVINYKNKKIKLSLSKPAFKILDKSIEAIKNTSTESISNQYYKLSDYDEKYNTIKINNQVVKVQIIKDMIRVATHEFNL
jgi:hypothetical protein